MDLVNIERELMAIGRYEGEAADWERKAGPGEWDREPFDFGWWTDEATGLTCAIKRNHGGAWCGYVFVPTTHPANQKVDDPDVGGDLTGGNPTWFDVHGGVTWHGPMEVEGMENAGVAVGFDTAHSGDFVPAMDRGWNRGTYRTARYVIDEVRSLAKQIHGFQPVAQIIKESVNV